MLFDQHISEIGKSIKKCDTKEEILKCFESSVFDVTKSFTLLNTIQKVKTAARNKGLFCEPTQFEVRSETIQILGDLEDKQYTGTIMPIKHEVKGFLEMPGVLATLIDNQNRMLRSPFPNLVNGAIGKEILRKNENKTVIFIGLYQDDFNPDNALGSNATSTKLSAYYYNYPTLPEHLAVNLKYIFVAAVHKAKDVNNKEVLEHGVDPGIYAIWGAFHPLEVDGLELEIDGQRRKVYLAISQFVGDNLGLNTAFGFSRGFTANYCCRICEIRKDVMESTYVLDPNILRKEDNFNECLEETNNEARKGVRYDSWLNKFQYFRVFFNYSLDLMHDIFLGVFRYDLTAILRYYILVKGVFSLKEFNEAKRSFEYGRKDKGI